MPLTFLHNPLPGVTLALWHLTEDLEQLTETVFLHAEEEIAFRSYKNELRKKQWIAVRGLIRQIMPKKTLIRYDSHGKPYIDDNSAHISISHSASYVAVMVSKTHPCGIDIEIPRDKILRVASRFLSAEEAGQLKEPEYLNKLMIYWCGKEALFKMAGIPGLDMQNEIVISGFDYLCGEWGTCRGTIRRGSRSTIFPLHFLVEAGFILAFTLNQENTEDEKEPAV